MKICCSCKISKYESEFTKRKRTKDGLNQACKECTRKLGRSHYLRNKQYYVAKAHRNKKKLDQLIKKIKESTPCKDCGQKYPYYVMDFDHRNGEEKKFCIAECRFGIKTLLKEIEKCDVVCSNCHRERTHQRQ